MKPCIILWSKIYERYESFNEDGRLILIRDERFRDDAIEAIEQLGYYIVGLNSRCGRTILDKVEERRMI